MKNRFIVLAFALIAIFSGCEGLGDNSMTEEEFDAIFDYEFNEDVRYYDESFSSYISLVNDTTMFIRSDMPEEHIPHAGEVILCPSTESTPHGFLRRVVSMEERDGGMTVNTEPATIADAFYTLQFEQKYNYAECVKEFRDSLGNEIPFEIIEGSVLEQLDSVKRDSVDKVMTKVDGDLDLGSKSIKLDISNRFFQGSTFVESEIYVKFDIGFGKVKEVSYVIEKRVGVKGKALISSGEMFGKDYEDDFSIPILDKSIPFGTPIGPPLMQFFPSLNFGISFIANGNLSLEGEVNYILEDTESRYSYINGVEHKEVINNLQNNGSWMKMVSLEADGEFGLKGTAGIELRLWNGDLLAFGGEAAFWFGMETKASISMSDNALLIQSPQINVRPSLSAALYIESYFINNRQHRIEAKVERSFEKFDISLLPKFEFEEEKSNTQLTVKPIVEPICMMEVSQQGFALFSDKNPDTPIAHKSLPPSTIIEEVPTEEYEDLRIEPEQIVFSLPSDPDKEYFVKPYVISDGKYYYGEGGSDIWVDLGLPSGILWAKYNVGATSPEEYGGYYAWGETEEKSSYSWENYKYGKIHHYTNEGNPVWVGIYLGDDISQTQYDVAHIKWGEGARMPNKADIQELLNHCAFTMETLSGILGAMITGPNSNYIFLPFCGRRYPDGVHNTNIGYYWTSSYREYDDTENFAYTLYCGNEDEFKWYADWNWHRNYGQSIRPVKDK